MKACVVNIKKADCDVNIMRPSKWGNPFVIGRDGTRDEVIDKFEKWIQTQPELRRAAAVSFEEWFSGEYARLSAVTETCSLG